MTGYSGTPLAKKLGIKPGSEVLPLGEPANYRSLLEPLLEGVRFAVRLSEATDVVHFFTDSRAELEGALATFRAGIRPDAIVWISWPKKASKVPTDVTEDVVRELALPLGLVDVKVCAVDEIWSGLKLVVRKELR